MGSRTEGPDWLFPSWEEAQFPDIKVDVLKETFASPIDIGVAPLFSSLRFRTEITSVIPVALAPNEP